MTASLKIPWIVDIPPLARPPLKDMLDQHKSTRDLHARSRDELQDIVGGLDSECRVLSVIGENFPSARKGWIRYGGPAHIKALGHMMMSKAYDIYADLSSNIQTIQQIHLIASGSGCLFALRLIQLIQVYDTTIYDEPSSFEVFNTRWSALMEGDLPAEKHTEPLPVSRHGIPISDRVPRLSDLLASLILIQPSLPVPRRVLFLGWSARVFYRYTHVKKLKQPPIIIIVGKVEADSEQSFDLPVDYMGEFTPSSPQGLLALLHDLVLSSVTALPQPAEDNPAGPEGAGFNHSSPNSEAIQQLPVLKPFLEKMAQTISSGHSHLEEAIRLVVSMMEFIQAGNANQKSCHELSMYAAAVLLTVGQATRRSEVSVSPSLALKIPSLQQIFQDVHTEVVQLAQQSGQVAHANATPNRENIEKSKERLREWLTGFEAERVINSPTFSEDFGDMDYDAEQVIQNLIREFQQQSTVTLPSHAGGQPIVPTMLVKLPPPPAHFSGREEEVELLVNLIVSSPPVHACIRGLGGIGKSALALAVMHDPRVIDFFGQSRFFVRLDGHGAECANDILTTLACHLGLIGNDVSQRLFDTLENSSTPYLFTLDNLEIPWDSEHRTAVEHILAQLSSMHSVSLIMTLRGTEYPHGIKLAQPHLPPLMPLSPSAAQDMLWSTVEKRSSDWDKLLMALDCIPLAITLVSQLAELGEHPTTLLQRWQSVQTAPLQCSSYPDQHSSVDVSILLSLSCPRMEHDPYAADLLSVLSLLPDGIQESELVPIMEQVIPTIRPTLSLLFKVALAYKDEQTAEATVRILSPIRAFMQAYHPADQDLQSPILSHYLARASESGEVWSGRAHELVPLLAVQVANIQAVLSLVLRDSPSEVVLDAIIKFGRFTAFTNIGGTVQLQAATLLLRDAKVSTWLSSPTRTSYEAQCLETMGDIHFRRSQLAEALAQYEEALELFRAAGDLVRQGNCLNGMGNIHFQRSELDEALSRYEEALELFKRAYSLLGQGNCLNGMGNIHLQRSELDEALIRYEEALELFKGAHDPVGQSNCLKCMGNIHLQQFKYVEALGQYVEALELFKAAGDPVGQGNCLKSMGDVHLRRSEPNEAQRMFTDALALYKSAGLTDGSDNVISVLEGLQAVNDQRDPGEV